MTRKGKKTWLEVRKKRKKDECSRNIVPLLVNFTHPEQQGRQRLTYRQAEEGVPGRIPSSQVAQVEGRPLIFLWDRSPGGRAESGRKAKT